MNPSKFCELFCPLQIDPYTLVEDLQGMLFEAFNLTCRTPFAIYEQAEANEERILELKERVADVVAGWENGPLIDEIEVDDGKKVRPYILPLKM